MPHAYQTEKTVIGMFFTQAEKYKYDDFLVAKLKRGKPVNEWIPMSWSDVATEVRRTGAGLIGKGINKGDRVAIFAHNRPRWVISDLGIQGAGAIGVPIYPTSTDKQLAFILNDCKARAIITGDKELTEQALRVKAETPSVEFIVSMEPVEDPPDPCVIDFDELMNQGARSEEARAEFDKRWRELTPDDDAAIIYTSGTTGEPKGVVLVQSNFMAQTDMLLDTTLTKRMMERGIRLFSLCHLPLCHIYGRTADYYVQMAMGGKIYFAESIKKVPENLLEVRPQMLITIPRLFEKIYEIVQVRSKKMQGVQKKVFDWAISVGSKVVDHMENGVKMPTPLAVQFALANVLVYDKIKKMAGLDRLVLASNGGGALSRDTNRFFRSMNIQVAEGYGLTETTSAVTWNTTEFMEPLPDTWLYKKVLDWLIDCMVVMQGKGKDPFGDPIGFLKMTVVSQLLIPKLVMKPGTVGRPCKNTEIKIAPDGEILAKGPQVFRRDKGYFNRPDLTAEVFTEDGFFMTGDIGEFDKDGFLKITDRKKELIVTAGGKNVAPHPIELALTFDTLVEQACVIGDGKKYISALIVPQFELLEKLAKEKGITFSSREELVSKPEIKKIYEEIVERANKNLARYEQVKKFCLLPVAFSEETGELTPTQKIKRRVIHEKFAKEIMSCYEE